MNLILVFSLSLFGLLMGLLSLAGATQGVEWVLWLVIAIVTAVLIAKQGKGKFFVSGLSTGFLDGILNSLTQASFFDLYLSNNEEVAAQMSQIPGWLDPRFSVLLAGPVIGLMYGVVVGLFCLVGRRVLRASQEAGQGSRSG